MLLSHSSLSTIHRYCSKHRDLLEHSASAGCVHCGATFSPTQIRVWREERDHDTGRVLGDTAKCPKCGWESVLPSAAPVVLTPQLLHAMQTYWFQGPR